MEGTDTKDMLVAFEEKVASLIDLMNSAPDEHKHKLWEIWEKLTVRVQAVVKSAAQKESEKHEEMAEAQMDDPQKRQNDAQVQQESKFPSKKYVWAQEKEDAFLQNSTVQDAAEQPNTETDSPNHNLCVERRDARAEDTAACSDSQESAEAPDRGSPGLAREQTKTPGKDSTRQADRAVKRGRKRKLEYTFTILQDGKCRCDICQKVLGNRPNAIAHSRIHTGERPYKCLLCSADFTTKPNLRRHELSHEGIKNHECPECHRWFSEKKSVKLHMFTHTGERPFKCDQCDAAFRQQGTLQAHKNIHTGYKGHVCDVCGRSFRQKSQMRLHQLRHQNKRTFPCDVCSKSYFSKGDLNRHQLSVHSAERPHRCDLCDKQFTRLQYLRDHVNTHTGNKPYTCAECGDQFGEYKSLHRHKETCERSRALKVAKTVPRKDKPVPGAEGTVEVVASASAGGEPCVLYVDPDELAREVAGGADVYIAGLGQQLQVLPSEGTSGVVIIEQLDNHNTVASEVTIPLTNRSEEAKTVEVQLATTGS